MKTESLEFKGYIFWLVCMNCVGLFFLNTLDLQAWAKSLVFPVCLNCKKVFQTMVKCVLIWESVVETTEASLPHSLLIMYKRKIQHTILSNKISTVKQGIAHIGNSAQGTQGRWMEESPHTSSHCCQKVLISGCSRLSTNFSQLVCLTEVDLTIKFCKTGRATHR